MTADSTDPRDDTATTASGSSSGAGGSSGTAGRAGDSSGVPTAPQVEAALTPMEWGKDWQRRFLVAFARTLNVSQACRTAATSTSTVYRELAADEVFKAAFGEAREVGIELREQVLDQWVMHGKPVTTERSRVKRARDASGALVVVEEETVREETREHSPALLMFALRAHRPSRYRDRLDLRHGFPGHDNEFGADPGGGNEDEVFRAPTRDRMLELAALARELEVPVVINGHARIVDAVPTNDATVGTDDQSDEVG